MLICDQAIVGSLCWIGWLGLLFIDMLECQKSCLLLIRKLVGYKMLIEWSNFISMLNLMLGCIEFIKFPRVFICLILPVKQIKISSTKFVPVKDIIPLTAIIKNVCELSKSNEGKSGLRGLPVIKPSWKIFFEQDKFWFKQTPKELKFQT